MSGNVPPCNLLAFDTSTELMAVALRAGAVDHLALEAGGKGASAALLPRIQALLAGAGLVMSDLDAIAFGNGPGAFTGLRTSCAVAQGLGFGLGRPLLPLDSLLIVAEDARWQAAPDAGVFEIAVAMDARMDEVYAGRYRWSEGRWRTSEAPALYTLPALAQRWTPMAARSGWLAGSAIDAFGSRLGVPAGVPRVAGEHDRAAALLRLARAAFHAGEGVDAADALPLYLRDKVAFTTQEREVAREVAAGTAPGAAP
jgi:tRNA threonylcarbamoyladenosine biosynthesis protein TsaB